MWHPNYTAEQSVWILFYGFSIVATEQWINWSVIGCILLLMLFQGLHASVKEYLQASILIIINICSKQAALFRSGSSVDTGGLKII